MNVSFDNATREAVGILIRQALAEDLGEEGDLTSSSLIDPGLTASIDVSVREHGVIAGQPAAEMVFTVLDKDVAWTSLVSDGAAVQPGTIIARVSGSVCGMLTGERTALNLLMHLSGIATLTAEFVQHAAGTKALILDTRKTLPGYRRLAKYAVACGGGTNHRMGLYDGVLIKDNHLAARGNASVADAITTARTEIQKRGIDVPIECEVDSMEQFEDALTAGPDIILLDNLPPGTLEEAVRRRDAVAPDVRLEASGGVNLQTIEAIAQSGVDRISIGALTHSAKSLDIGFDWPKG